jgi:hypoxia up-regulated 1
MPAQDQITSVVMTGGASRTPMIKSAVVAAVGNDKIAVNVNADEAAVLGAALYGAGLSRQFKTKDIRVTDTTVHDVLAVYPAEKGKKTLSAAIFGHGAKTGTRKTMSFKRKEDFALTLAYKQPPAPGFPTQLLEAHIVGVAEAVKNLTDMGASETIVKATLALSESGFASVKEAVVVGEIKDESFTGMSIHLSQEHMTDFSIDKLKGLFGGGSSSDANVTDSSSSTSTSASESATDKNKKPAVKEEKIPLTIDIKFLDFPPMSVAEKRTARDK